MKKNMNQMVGLFIVTFLLGCGGKSAPEKNVFKGSQGSNDETSVIEGEAPPMPLVSVKLICKLFGRLKSGEAVYVRGDLPELGNSSDDLSSARPLEFVEFDSEGQTWSTTLTDLPLSLDVNWQCIIGRARSGKVTEGPKHQFNTGDSAGQIADQYLEIKPTYYEYWRR